jgi:hypothetical protein
MTLQGSPVTEEAVCAMQPSPPNDAEEIPLPDSTLTSLQPHNAATGARPPEGKRMTIHRNASWGSIPGTLGIAVGKSATPSETVCKTSLSLDSGVSESLVLCGESRGSPFVELHLSEELVSKGVVATSSSDASAARDKSAIEKAAKDEKGGDWVVPVSACETSPRIGFVESEPESSNISSVQANLTENSRLTSSVGNDTACDTGSSLLPAGGDFSVNGADVAEISGGNSSVAVISVSEKGPSGDQVNQTNSNSVGGASFRNVNGAASDSTTDVGSAELTDSRNAQFTCSTLNESSGGEVQATNTGDELQMNSDNSTLQSNDLGVGSGIPAHDTQGITIRNDLLPSCEEHNVVAANLEDTGNIQLERADLVAPASGKSTASLEGADTQQSASFQGATHGQHLQLELKGRSTTSPSCLPLMVKNFFFFNFCCVLLFLLFWTFYWRLNSLLLVRYL